MRSVLLHLRSCLAALLLGLSFLAPAHAQEAGSGELDGLFAQLRMAPNADAAKIIDGRIWSIWLTPHDPVLARRMAQVIAARQNMDLDIALGVLAGVVRDYPDYAEGWNQRATIYYLKRDFEHSLADIDRALALEPRHYGALSGRALIYLAQDRRDLALRDIAAALRLHPFLAEKQLFPELLKETTHI